MNRAIIALLALIVVLQVIIVYQLSDHDERMERRHSYAIDARNAIRDQLDRLNSECVRRAQ